MNFPNKKKQFFSDFSGFFTLWCVMKYKGGPRWFFIFCWKNHLKGVWTLGGEIWQKNANFGASFWKTVILFGKTFYTIGLYANVPTKWHILFPSVNSIMAIFRTPKFGVFAILMMQKAKSPARNRTIGKANVGLQYNHSAMVADSFNG